MIYPDTALRNVLEDSFVCRCRKDYYILQPFRSPMPRISMGRPMLYTSTRLSTFQPFCRARVAQVFMEVGAKELVFIERSGLLFGFIFGCLQTCLWYFYQEDWVLPIGGLVVRNRDANHTWQFSGAVI